MTIDKVPLPFLCRLIFLSVCSFKSDHWAKQYSSTSPGNHKEGTSDTGLYVNVSDVTHLHSWDHQAGTCAQNPLKGNWCLTTPRWSLLNPVAGGCLGGDRCIRVVGCCYFCMKRAVRMVGCRETKVRAVNTFLIIYVEWSLQKNTQFV